MSYEECKNNKVLNKVYIESRLRLLKPKIIVEYDRTAFISKVGNIRITFDKNIRTSNKVKRFFEDNIYASPINDLNTHVLEVKYDEFIPQYILSTLELNTLRQTSYSKYYLSRLYIGDENYGSRTTQTLPSMRQPNTNERKSLLCRLSKSIRTTTKEH